MKFLKEMPRRERLLFLWGCAAGAIILGLLGVLFTPRSTSFGVVIGPDLATSYDVGIANEYEADCMIYKPCDKRRRKHGDLNAIFKPFKKIIVYYGGFNSKYDQQQSEFPAFLKYDYFNDFVEQNVQTNFKSCLSHYNAGPVEVVKPGDMRENYANNPDEDKLEADVYDSDNLTIFVKEFYNTKFDIGWLHVGLYRPGMSREDAFANAVWNLHSVQLNFKSDGGEEKIKNGVNQAFRELSRGFCEEFDPIRSSDPKKGLATQF